MKNDEPASYGLWCGALVDFDVLSMFHLKINVESILVIKSTILYFGDTLPCQ